MSRKKKSVVKTQKPASRIHVRQFRALNDVERRMAFCIEESHPLWRGIMDIIDEFVEDHVEGSSDPALAGNHGALAFGNGGLRTLLDLRSELMREREQSYRVKEDKPAPDDD